MRIHEYQAKELLAQYGVPILRGRVASSPTEVLRRAAELGGPVIIKAQVHAGGRGKGGGVKFASGPKEAELVAGEVIGMTLITPQTGPEGRIVRRVLVEEQTTISRELYFAILIDDTIGRPVLMASAQGGMDIEEVAASNPEAIRRVVVDPAAGFQPYQAREIAFDLGLDGELLRPATQLITQAFKLFVEKDCSLLEINPLIVTNDAKILALDAKLSFDDNALFRHPDIADLRDIDEEDPLEVWARHDGINNYVKLSGNIGCMVNGAGLAMATMDAIKFAGGEPANFLDIGTVNDSTRVTNAFRIITADPNVRAILINIFGGMARVDVVVEGIIEAFKQMDIRIPVVVRLLGINFDEGLRLLDESGLPIQRAEDLGEAVRKAVKAAGAVKVR